MEKYSTKNKNIINRKCKFCCDKFINCIIGIFSYNKGSGKILKDNIDDIACKDNIDAACSKYNTDNKEIEVGEIEVCEIEVGEIEKEDIIDNKEWVMA